MKLKYQIVENNVVPPGYEEQQTNEHGTWGKNKVWLSNNDLRLEAEQKGEIFYTRITPCRRGHLSKRYVKNNHCVECSNIGKMEYHKNTPIEKKRAFRKKHHLRQLYDLTIEQYEEMHKNQNGLCALCDNPEKSISHKSKTFKKLAVDHCKITLKIRGLLCQKCNQAIGLLNHNSELLRKAALYCE